MTKFFGHPPGVKVGDLFIDRAELRAAGVHAPLQAGIHGNAAEGADSIVISGGYGDDADFGDFIIYTGHGGRDANTGKQIAHQSIDAPGNAGLITSMQRGLPVRVTRKAGTSQYAPPVGFQYAGLFSVSSPTYEPGNEGFNVVKFRLDRLAEQAPLVTATPAIPDPAYATTTVTRRIRDSAVSRKVKELYDFSCQLCGTSIVGLEGRRYAEGAHVRPLGNPHLGGDQTTNLLSLCPNHHTALDLGGLYILDDMSVETPLGEGVGGLSFLQWHTLDVANAKYHRETWQSVAAS